MNKILKQITDLRNKRISEKGFTFGYNIPEKRIYPIVRAELNKSIVICEIKRGSPSEGKMNTIDNPVEWGERYFNAGADVISVLTEEDHFFGSLDDLMKLKSSFPERCFLRKDFIQHTEDIDIAYRAGADMILLIAAILDDQTLAIMKNHADKLGLASIIEVHTEDELKRVLKVSPQIIGINSRNLDTFEIDRNYPHALKQMIPQDIKVVYESGIRDYHDTFFCGVSGFDGLLIGTGIVKSRDLNKTIANLISGFRKGRSNCSPVYSRFFYKYYIENKPFIKICGITTSEDADFVADYKPDMLGFVFAQSPRRVSCRSLKDITVNLNKNIIKTAVVVDKIDIENAVFAYREGLIDIIQYHGEIDNEEAYEIGIPWYKAIRMNDPEMALTPYRSPFVLFDAFDRTTYGGTGKRLDDVMIKAIMKDNRYLCLAGGINNSNISEILNKYAPAMIDLSSGLENAPGIKDHRLINDFFKAISGYSPARSRYNALNTL